MASGKTAEVVQEESRSEAKSVMSKVSAALNRDDLIQLVTLELGGEEYGLRIGQVQEIIRMRNIKITVIPNAPAFIEGVINLRGRMIPVVDLRTRFGMERQERGRSNRIVVINVGERTVGLVVDAVVEVVRVPDDELEVLPDLVTNDSSDFISGACRVDDRMIIVLDIEKLFDTGEQESIQDIA